MTFNNCYKPAHKWERTHTFLRASLYCNAQLLQAIQEKIQMWTAENSCKNYRSKSCWNHPNNRNSSINMYAKHFTFSAPLDSITCWMWTTWIHLWNDHAQSLLPLVLHCFLSHPPGSTSGAAGFHLEKGKNQTKNKAWRFCSLQRNYWWKAITVITKGQSLVRDFFLWKYEEDCFQKSSLNHCSLRGSSSEAENVGCAIQSVISRQLLHIGPWNLVHLSTYGNLNVL